MSWLSRVLCRALKINVYELRDGMIIRHKSRNQMEQVNCCDIVAWSVEYEMVFDLVTIMLNDGSQLTWEDEYNDLLAILRAVLPRAEQKPPSSHLSHRSSP